MSRFYKKLSALTLSEMLVVLLLTIIVVGLAFSILGLVQKQMFGIQENYERKTVDNLLQQGMWIDFNSNSRIEFSSKTNSIMLSNEIEEKQYGFYDGYVTRGRDTFFTDFKVGKLYFQGNEVMEGMIDAIELSTNYEKENDNMIFVYKKNTAADFMN